MQIGGTAIPDTEPYRMGSSGSYKPDPPVVVGQDGEAMDVVAGYAKVTWSWEALSHEMYQFWTTTILSGQPSLAFTSAQLYDHTPALVTYTRCVVHRPTFDKFENGEVIGVQVVIDDLRV